MLAAAEVSKTTRKPLTLAVFKNPLGDLLCLYLGRRNRVRARLGADFLQNSPSALSAAGVSIAAQFNDGLLGQAAMEACAARKASAR